MSGRVFPPVRDTEVGTGAEECGTYVIARSL